MDTENYFILFDVPESFKPDMDVLKSRYYALSRSTHPDYFTLSGADKQDEMLRRSGIINIAYKTLSDERERMRYLLSIHGLLDNEEKLVLPPDFLMEIMDLNEVLADMNDESDSASLKSISSTIDSIEEDCKMEVEGHILAFEQNKDIDTHLEKIKEYYLKTKYLLRLREKLSTFAHANK